MLGISFAYPDISDQFRHPPWTELRVARVEPGPDVNLTNGKHIDGFYWRQWELPLEERTRLMDVVTELVREHKVDGFTLWWNWTKKEWQMNVRQEGEAWSVNYISQADAEKIFATLEAHHPGGPWSVREYVQDDVAARANFAKRPETPAAREERQIEDEFNRTLEWVKKSVKSLPLVEPDLLDALKAAETAVQRGNEALARVIA